jgi:capsular exopolysaccharide synthesis family protein
MLFDNSLLDEIRRLHEDGQTGLLSFASGNGERIEVFFREGLIDAATSSLSEYQLGGYLVGTGRLAARDLHVVETETHRHKILFGEAAVRKNLVVQPVVGVAVRRQAMELLRRVVEEDGFFVDSFTNCLRSYYAPARISFPQVLLELSRSNPVLIEPNAATQIVVSKGLDLSVFHWSPEELSILGQIQYPTTFGELVAATGLEPAAIRLVLGTLQRLEILETWDAPESNSSEGIVKSARDSNSILRDDSFPFEELIPLVPNPVLNEKLTVATQGSSFAGEQFKTLKVQLSAATSQLPLKVFTVSSPDAWDGKSLVSSTLAFSFAMDPGRRVIIVDCDLRSPGLEKYLGVTSEPGLLQYLTNGRLGPHCYMRRIDNLYFLTTGGIAQNAIEILSMQKMKQLIDSLRRDFDTIILDAPPYSPIADARIVTGLSDGLIMVIRRGKTSYSSADRAFKAIDRNKLLGVVFNDVKPMMFHTYQSFGTYSYGNTQSLYSSDRAPNRPKKFLRA